MLAFCSARHAVTFASDPGRSRTSTRTRARRPARTMPRSTISASISGSMLPPHSTRPTWRPAVALRVAQQGGEARRARALDDRLLDLQEHHDGLLDVALVHEHDVGDEARDDLPRDPAGLASPRCPRRWWRRRRRASVPRSAWYMEGKRIVSTPITSMAGFSALAAVAMPAMSPPPPIATTQQRRAAGARPASRARSCPARRSPSRRRRGARA